MHPAEQLGVVRAVSVAAAEGSRGVGDPAVDAIVHGVDPRRGVHRGFFVPERQRQHGADGRSESRHAGRQSGAEPAVIVHAARDERVRELQQNRPQPAGNDDDLPVDLPGDAVRPGPAHLRASQTGADRRAMVLDGGRRGGGHIQLSLSR